MLPLVPNIRDFDSIHSNATYSNSDLEDFVHGFEQVVHLFEELASNL
jgi:hypothetical protein